MAAPLSFRIVDKIRRATTDGRTAAEASQEEIELARKPYAVGVAGERAKLVQPLVDRLFGTRAPGVLTTEIVVPGAVGDRPARLHQPAGGSSGPRPFFLHLHGGGWTVGGPEQYDPLVTHLVAELGCVAVSVDYRKAPEHPAPAATDDVIAVATWLAEGAIVDFGGDPEQFFVGGDSAGGNLSALVAIALRDAGLRLAAQVLIYPGTDLTMSSRSARELRSEPILSGEAMDAYVGLYLSGGVAADDPRVSPAFVADKSGLAPALVITGERDPLRDEGIAYAEALRDAGVPVRHTNYVDMPHGFVSTPGMTRLCKQAWAEIVDFVRATLRDD
mgnify:CR=1 FL=1